MSQVGYGEMAVTAERTVWLAPAKARMTVTSTKPRISAGTDAKWLG